MIKDVHASSEHHFSAAAAGDREIGPEETDDLLLYGAGDFPPLPEFPCMSSSSSTSSTAVLKSDVEEDHHHHQAAALCSTASMECMDLMIESSNEFFDPSSLFLQDYPVLEDFQVADLKQHQNEDQENFGYQEHDQLMMNNYDNTTTESTDRDSGDLGNVFLEWLKSNKEAVCADDLRKVKIKKATIECAAKRLGGGREGMKHLLKLILEWVQSNHLHKRRLEEDSPVLPFQNPNSWTSLEPPGYNPAMAPPCYPYPAQDYHSSQTWPASQFALHAPPYSSFPDHVAVVRLGSSATKEARKKRMARQRRFFAHHQNSYDQQHARDTNQGNWMYHCADGHKVNLDRQSKHNSSNDRRQGWKPEKNLRFLLQKVLKQSDVGNLGRIVLPKKEAETHLPELEARDGIAISMEDIGTSRVWNMRYRFWPNNKSRMYLLENTGDFVRTNGLQEGDFIVIYSDVKCGKYLIRGVKVRQAGPKPEAKRPAKSLRNQQAASPAGNGSS